MTRPLQDIMVLDFSQYLAGPSAALRLADLGARVIKVENPKTGDNSRHLSLKNMVYDGDSVNFQAINRDKESFAANLKDPEDLKLVKALVKKADVLIENFRPGIMAKFGLDYESTRVLNPRLIYATVTGYGIEGPWKSKPGQDLLLQSMSGLAYTNGNGDQPPTPLGISMADIFAGTHMVDGILACLVRRSRTGEGGRVEVSLLESIRKVTGKEPTISYFASIGDFNYLGTRLGAPAIIFGADGENYHSSDEYVLLDSVHQTAEAVYDFLEKTLLP